MEDDLANASHQAWSEDKGGTVVPVKQEATEDGEDDVRDLVPDDATQHSAGSSALGTLHHTDDGNSSSELSSLAATPSPPATPRTANLLRPPPTRLECTHTSWCDCPMHASHELGMRIPHLSEWALSQMALPESNTRGEACIKEDTKRYMCRTKEWSEWVATALPIISLRNPEKLHPVAQTLVEHIDRYFNPPLLDSSVARPIPVIEKIGKAINDWKKDLDYDRLEATVQVLLEQRTDLMFLFQNFLPARLRKLTLEDLQEAEKQRKAPGRENAPYWVGIEELEKSRSEFCGWEKHP